MYDIPESQRDLRSYHIFSSVIVDLFLFSLHSISSLLFLSFLSNLFRVSNVRATDSIFAFLARRF